MSNLLKYIAIALFFASAPACMASDQEQIDLEAQRAPVVVRQQHTVSPTAKAFFKHGLMDIAFLGTTAARQISDRDAFQLLFLGVQVARYYYLAMANVHATSDAMKYKSWPLVLFAATLATHTIGDAFYDLPNLSIPIVNSGALQTILKGLPIIADWEGASQNIVGFVADAAGALKPLSVIIAGLTFTLILYRYQHDGTWDALKKKAGHPLLEQKVEEGEPPVRGRSRTRVKRT